MDSPNPSDLLLDPDEPFGTIDGRPITVRDLIRSGHCRECFLCGSDSPAAVGVYHASPERYSDFVGAMMKRGMGGFPDPDKVRLAVYALCEDCLERPDCADEVERRLFAPVEG